MYWRAADTVLGGRASLSSGVVPAVSECCPACRQSELVIHSENNSPFLAVTRLTRHIEVSHWGAISVEETVDVRHTGARLRGSFSRFDYQREHNSGVSSVQQFKVGRRRRAGRVPAAVHNSAITNTLWLVWSVL